jgi:hypothetical protein
MMNALYDNKKGHRVVSFFVGGESEMKIELKKQLKK